MRFKKSTAIMTTAVQSTSMMSLVCVEHGSRKAMAGGSSIRLSTNNNEGAFRDFKRLAKHPAMNVPAMPAMPIMPSHRPYVAAS